MARPLLEAFWRVPPNSNLKPPPPPVFGLQLKIATALTIDVCYLYTELSSGRRNIAKVPHSNGRGRWHPRLIPATTLFCLWWCHSSHDIRIIAFDVDCPLQARSGGRSNKAKVPYAHERVHRRRASSAPQQRCFLWYYHNSDVTPTYVGIFQRFLSMLDFPKELKSVEQWWHLPPLAAFSSGYHGLQSRGQATFKEDFYTVPSILLLQCSLSCLCSSLAAVTESEVGRCPGSDTGRRDDVFTDPDRNCGMLSTARCDPNRRNVSSFIRALA